MSRLNILVFSTLYPNQIQFRHGIFVETRIRHLKQSEQANITVIAPVPWFPCKLKWFPRYSQLVDVPYQETRHGVEIYHPRYIVIPKIGMLLTPFFLAFTLYRQIKRLTPSIDTFDVIDAHYYYPDGVSAAIVAKLFNKPLAITARGSDISQIADDYWPRKMILWASRVAKYNQAVCKALIDRMLELGINPNTTHVLRNGVDLNLFSPSADRDALKQKWQVQRPLLISVGYLIERKGHHLIVEALSALPEFELFIVGSGEMQQTLTAQVAKAGLTDRVRFISEVKQEQLAELYNCADALVLASSREGWANVLLEAMACGTPVVATRIWGTPEVVQAAEAGILCQERTSEAIASAVKELFAHYPDRQQTRRYAETFSWEETTSRILGLFKKM